MSGGSRQPLDVSAWRRAQESIQAAAEALDAAIASSPVLTPDVPSITTNDTPNGAVRALREALGVSQGRLGELRGVHPDSHAKIEHADDLRWSTMVSIAKALGSRVTVTFRGPNGETFAVSEAP